MANHRLPMKYTVRDRAVGDLQPYHRREKRTLSAAKADVMSLENTTTFYRTSPDLRDDFLDMEATYRELRDQWEVGKVLQHCKSLRRFDACDVMNVP